ncbi:hypothetical protein ABK046_26495 [Streptomyces caeruleatus]
MDHGTGDSGQGGAAVTLTGPAVARTEPVRISAKATPTPTVRGSERNSTPATTATAGLTYVITVALVGPISLISSRKATNATAVQSTPRPARATSTEAEGMAEGRVSAAPGAYTRAASARHGAVSWRDGTSFSQRAAISGAVAYPTTVTSTSASDLASPPVRCGTVRTPTPASPSPRPVTRRTPNLSVSPKKRARRTPTIGTPAISRPAVELERCRSASVSVYQGPMISMTAKASMGSQCARTVRRRPPCRIANGSSSSAPTAHRTNTTNGADSGASTATLIIR